MSGIFSPLVIWVVINFFPGCKYWWCYLFLCSFFHPVVDDEGARASSQELVGRLSPTPLGTSKLFICYFL